jgi:hypothetical protein
MGKKFLIFSIILLLVFSFLVSKEAKAQTQPNVAGWAWSENIG